MCGRVYFVVYVKCVLKLYYENSLLVMRHASHRNKRDDISYGVKSYKE